MTEELGARMTLVGHLEELRTRLIRSLAALLAGFTGAMFLQNALIDVMTIPHFRAMSMLDHPPSSANFIAESYAGSVMAIVKLSLIVGLFIASPFVGRELWKFVAAGLYARERRCVAAFAPASFLLFVLGCVFGYFVLIPYSLYGMASMLPADKIDPVFSFGEYLNLVLTLTILLGAVFQLPLVMVLLVKLGIVTPPDYGKWRRAAIAANILLAAILSPADPASMVFFALPLVGLYEAGIVVSRWA